jgi:CheY-like chemotaxis protein
MPNLDGNATTRRIRGELGMTALPIVALTAGALVGERQRALEAGMNEFISKPFDPKALIRKVRGLVEAARREPIPMVMLDTKPVGYTAGRLLMSSVDAGVVQQMFGGDRSLFESLLARVLREFVDLSLPIDVSAADQATRSHLQGRAHKLKGSAGMLGATRVMRLAGSLEVALQEGRPTQVLAEMLRQLASALTVLREEAALLPEAPANGADPGASSAVPPLVDNAQISELYSLLESQNIAAIETFAMLLPTLRGVVGAVRLQRLSDAIDNLDFQLGAQLLRETQSAGPLEEKSGGQLPATPLGA